MENQNVAVYLDFENLAISAEEAYPSRDKPLLIEPIVDFAATKGNICIKKAYADWSVDMFMQYQGELMEQGFELIHLPATSTSGKNGSDVRLAIDAMENMELFATVNTFLIGSGDTDFVALVQRIRARGKNVVVIGFEHSVGRMLKINSAEYKSMEELLGQPEEFSLSSDLVQDVDLDFGREIMLRYLKNKTDDEPVLMARLKQDLLRLDPSFSEKKLGFSSFKKYVKSLQGDIVAKIDDNEKSHMPYVYFKEVETSLPKQVNLPATAKTFLLRKIKFVNEAKKRYELSKVLFDAFRRQKTMTMHDMIEHLHTKTKNMSKVDIRKYINTLFTGRAFRAADKKAKGALLSKPFKLKTTINNPEILDQIYINRIGDILKNKYASISDKDIARILGLER